MDFRVKALVGVVAAGAIASLYEARSNPALHWVHFCVYLAAILLSSGMKVGMPKSDGTMSVNFPFILLGVVQLSPLQAVALAVSSVIAQCRIGVIRSFSPVQILFNVANVTTATVLAWHAYVGMTKLLHAEVAPALAVGAAVYFLANTIPLALILAWESHTSVFRQWFQEFPWYFPFYLVGAILAAAANFIGILFGWLTSMLLMPMVYTVYRAYRAQMATIQDRERHLRETEALHLRTIEGLAMAVEAKDKNTHSHLMRVRIYVSELGRIMGLDQLQMKALVTAAFLHDIGKLAVPEHIINKPGKLTQEEFEKMKIHPVVGAEILERVRFPYPVVPIVRSHHEAWDGSGYPDGLKGEEIPIGARILTVVDCFDALASERPYRRALPLDEAMAIVKSKAGTHFDPTVVSLLDEHYAELEKMSHEQHDEMEEMAPLDTDLFIERGAAPGAGFEPDHSTQSAGNVEAGAQSGALLAKLTFHEDVEQNKAIAELNRLLGTSLSARETSSMTSRRLGQLIPFDCFAVYIKSGGSILPQYIDGRLAQSFLPQPILIGEGLSGWVAQSGREIMNGNPTVEPNFLTGSDGLTASGSALAIPLIDLSDTICGVLALYSSKHAAFSKDHLRILQAIQARFLASLQNALCFRSGETEVKTDPHRHVLEGSVLV